MGSGEQPPAIVDKELQPGGKVGVETVMVVVVVVLVVVERKPRQERGKSRRGG